MTGLGHFAKLIQQRFALACRRLELALEGPSLDCTLFSAPEIPANDRQLSLF